MRDLLGDSACAIEAWQHAAGMLGGGDMAWPTSQRNNSSLGVGGDAFGVPYTLAIVYRTADTRNWKLPERTAILEVAHAWTADRK
ncbi:MAG: hypothetical protein ABIQ70_14415 [Dokdonella sp.]